MISPISGARSSRSLIRSKYSSLLQPMLWGLSLPAISTRKMHGASIVLVIISNSKGRQLPFMTPLSLKVLPQKSTRRLIKHTKLWSRSPRTSQFTTSRMSSHILPQREPKLRKRLTVLSIGSIIPLPKERSKLPFRVKRPLLHLQRQRHHHLNHERVSAPILLLCSTSVLGQHFCSTKDHSFGLLLHTNSG